MYIRKKYYTGVWTLGLGSTRKTDLMLQALLSRHLVVSILFLEENHRMPQTIHLEECAYFLLGLHTSIVSVGVSGLHSNMASGFRAESL
jgi:hypothetical protein